MNDGLNPTRRYKWFRPRQAARIIGSETVFNNTGEVLLYNNSTGAQLIVVRDIAFIGVGGNEITCATIQGNLGTLQTAAATNFFPGDGVLPGQTYHLDDTSPPAAQFFLAPPSGFGPGWLHDFPVAIIPPNQSLVLQSASAGMTVCFLYEAIFPDELDFAFEM